MTDFDAANLQRGIIQEFGTKVQGQDDVLQECVSLCQLFRMPPNELYISWEAFDDSSLKLSSSTSSARQKATSEVSVPLLRELKEWIHGKREREREAVGKPRVGMPTARRSLGGLMGRTGLGQTPGRQERPREAVAVRPRVEVKDVGEGKRNYRYMYGKLSQKAEILDDIIDDISELVRAHYDLEDLGDPASATDEDVVVVGRICSDADTGAKLTESSLLLESSRMGGSGVRTPLKFEHGFSVRGKNDNGFGLFPGQIVALKGKNGGGGWFSASEALEIPLLPEPPLPPTSSSTTSFNMVIACGPFTPDGDLLYRPFEQLLSEVSRSKPGVLLLLGPFIDSNHSLIRKGDVDHTPLQIFRHKVAGPLRRCMESNPGMSLVVVPSVRDLISFHSAFPQAALSDAEELGLPKATICLSNPCTALMNGVTIAASSVDVLFHLRKEEFVKRIEGSTTPLDPMASLAGHVLSQKSFYPIFPPTKDVSSDVNLDVLCYEFLRIGPTAPAVLVLPSMLKQFHKVVNDTLVINPSFLSRGSYAWLECPDATFAQEMGGKSAWEVYWKNATIDLRRLPTQ
ncbi:DNA polymerase alpha subunit B [Dacryopinax primogenitus]|uniref:DNA polymerase alpha subunit B n=1 Tax=Dacryopinax primogenitus (strain DJM 731) TaxID=1858805 RepID=M5G6E1_DACPD|nr:DNA polymerase alpha subunit B [Dacryopinax primogenitus]EJU05826.1 DNA polymerase alpha subunit B [Dacryopinax primogenitus]